MAQQRVSTEQVAPTEEHALEEKKYATAYATPITPGQEDLEDGGSSDVLAHWQPGFFAQFPWLGIGALGGVVLCLVASILVLVLSNDQTQTAIAYERAWPKAVAPNVLVSIFNVIALTALVAKVTVIDSTLLQKAIGTYTQEDYIGNKTQVAYGYINTTFPSTGLGFGTMGSGLQDWFNRDIEIWQTGGGVYPNQFYTYTTPMGQKINPITHKVKNVYEVYYNSTAYVYMNGAGLEIDCLDPVTENINASALAWPSQNSTEPKDQTLFAITFSTHSGIDGTVPDGPDAWVNNTDYIVMETVYSTAQNVQIDQSGSTQCPGQLVRQTCRLRAAVVRYPVELSQRGDENSWTARLGTDDDWASDALNFYHYNATLKQQNYFHVNRTMDLKDYPYAVPSSGGKTYGNNTYSGLAAGLQIYLGGYASISKVDQYSFYTLNQTGSAQTYLNNLPSNGECNFTFSRPLDGGQDLLGDYLSQGPKSKFINPGLIGKINAIMFGLATDVANMDPNNNYDEDSMLYYDASLYADTIHYSTNFWYMGGAIASTLLCIACVLPAYYGFWQLGRKVTLGPFEIAAAFRAPNLHHETCGNAPVDRLIKEVGEREVRFGQIVAGSDAGRIGVAESEFVRRVQPKIGDGINEAKLGFQRAIGV